MDLPALELHFLDTQSALAASGSGLRAFGLIFARRNARNGQRNVGG
jgi:hypothetical protein